MSDDLVSLFLESETFTLPTRDGILILEIVDIPTSKLFKGNETASSWQEEHVKNRLETIRQRTVQLLRTTAPPRETPVIQVDFRTMKVIRRPGADRSPVEEADLP